ncbi:MAG: ribosome biogenesis GTP-binding protein YihA/YsxC [bacterium]|nr:ribosome biogenesis GTP-binding protein YihA/YsxC [bacterium]
MAMKIKTAEFVKSAVRPVDYPELGLPEIAFVGRSNVGKSSLINRLLSRKSLAKTSSTPGKTRLINYFLINGDMVFVDLPGYGYAKISKSERDSLGRMVEKYLSTSKELKMVTVLQDMRREQTEMDITMIDLIRHHGIPVLLIYTKADKFSNNQRMKRLKELGTSSTPIDFGPIPFSSSTGAGREKVWELINEMIETEEETSTDE